MLYDLTTIKQEFNVPRERKEEYGEVTTDFKLIQDMFSQFPKEIFSNPNLKWLDVGAGKGYFSMVLFNKLYYGLESFIKQPSKRTKYILSKMITIIEINTEHLLQLKSFFGKDAKIEIRDFLSYDPYEKYDIIYGNPPYTCQGIIKTPTNKKNNKKLDGKCVWTNFVKHSLFLLKPGGFLSFIIPCLWMRLDKAKMHTFMLQYKLHKIKCLTNTQTNKWFKGNAQTPTCFFLLEKKENNGSLSLYDSCYNSYIKYNYNIENPLPLFGCSVIQKLRIFVEKLGFIKIEKTNMPQKNTKLSLEKCSEFLYRNIHTCLIENNSPKLKIMYSNKELKYYKTPKLVLPHKMYGFPFYDVSGSYGISNRDNYVILNKTHKQFLILQNFLFSKIALYVFESTRYRMKYLEREAFLFLPDVSKCNNFPENEEDFYDYFNINKKEKEHIINFSKNYKKYCNNI